MRHAVGPAANLPIGGLRRAIIADRTLCIARADDGELYAVDDACSHEQYSLSEGDVFGREVECPQHGSRFDLQTGQCWGLPATTPIRAYRVSIEDDTVFVEV